MLGSRTFWWGFLSGLVALGGMIAIARIARPAVIPVDQLVAASSLVLESQLAGMHTNGPRVLYIRSQGPELKVISALQLRYPKIQFLPWKDRPSDSGCDSPSPGIIVMAP